MPKKLLRTQLLKLVILQQKKAGDKIIQLLSKKGNKMGAPLMTQQTPTVEQPLTDYEINERVNQLLSGGKLRKLKFI